jgi:imidazolonepropionase-like amidohydrolase
MIVRGLFAVLLVATPAQSETLYIKAGTLIDVVAGRAIKGKCIMVDGERITSVGRCTKPPKAARVIDWRRYTVLPGLIDLHTHLADVSQSADVALPLKTSLSETVAIGAKNAEATLRAGFTTVRDVGTYRGLSDLVLRDAINAGRYIGPRMFVSGAYITIPGGGGELNGVGPLPEDMRLGVAATAEEAGAKSEFLLSQGIDQIKHRAGHSRTQL